VTEATYQTDTITLYHGDSLTVLSELDDCSVDSIVTDPPYELGFMGKSWDASGIAYSVDLWAECLRVLKPGGHLLAFGGTRTYHRMAVAIEDAGFEIRDSLHWVYGSGFPKSLDVSKAIDKTNGEPDRLHKFTAWMRTTGMTARQLDDITGTNMGGHYLTAKSQPAIPTASLWSVIRPHIADVPDWVDELVARIEAEREVVGERVVPIGHSFAGPTYGGDSSSREVAVTAPATDAAKQWSGWGTALKPAHEPIVLARKPLTGTVAQNVLQHGTGAINIDGCRVGTDSTARVNTAEMGYHGGNLADEYETGSPSGRWPANIIFDEEAGAELDAQSEGASRFFYCPKASRAERDAGLDDISVASKRVTDSSHQVRECTTCGSRSKRNGRWPDCDHDNWEWVPQKAEAHKGGNPRNIHPTVKPIALMRWLVRLITPPDGIVLDPFTGSGTTLAAATLEGVNAVGIELTDDYLPIIIGRCEHAAGVRAETVDDDTQLSFDW